VNVVTALAGIWKRKREDLKDRRIPLFRRYEKNPNDLRLALEIKLLDDQIAECTQEIDRENRKLVPVRVVTRAKMRGGLVRMTVSLTSPD
jgi:hypothetical protein